MATSSLIQFLAAGEAGDSSNRRQVETFLAGGAISEGDWVALDSSQAGADRVLYVVEAAASATGGVAIGVATEDAAAGERLDVVVAGYYPTAKVTTGVALNAPLSVDTTNGRADAADAANVVICGVCLELAAANVAPVHVYKRF